MRVSDPLLFLKYAIPCGSAMVKRGDLSQQLLDEMTDAVSREKTSPRFIAPFKTALAFCRAIARKKGKQAIDSEVIRSYFLERHNELLPSIAKPDVDLSLCRVRKGRVLKAGDDLLVLTELGEERASSFFAPSASEGDVVSLHYRHACEVLERSES